MKPRIVTIFGSGNSSQNSKNYRIAYDLGFLLAKAGFVIANGGYQGTMEAAARGAKEAGGEAIAITAKECKGTRNPYCKKEIKTGRFKNRLFKLIEISDAFVALDGGTGTAAEVAVVIEVMNKGFINKPTVILGKEMQKFVRAIYKLPEVGAHNRDRSKNGPVPSVVFKNSPEQAVKYLNSVIASRLEGSAKQSRVRRLPRRPAASSQ